MEGSCFKLTSNRPSLVKVVSFGYAGWSCLYRVEQEKSESESNGVSYGYTCSWAVSTGRCVAGNRATLGALPGAAEAQRCYDFRCQEWAATFLRSS
jgi:hypothetical protein